MPKHPAPDVDIEEVNRGTWPIEGVSTNTAGFVGETERGPTKPTLVTSWADFERTYGGYIDQPPLNAVNSNLPYAVQGFFENGGQRLYVARVIGAGAATAVGELAGANGPTVIEAAGAGDWGNRIRLAVRPASASTTLPPGSTDPSTQWFRLLVLYYREMPNRLAAPTDGAGLVWPDRHDPDAFEDFDNLTHDLTQPNYAVTVVNRASRLVRVQACPGPPYPVDFEAGILGRTPGAYAAADLTAFIGDASDPDDRTGLEGLLTIADISLLAVPDEVIDPTLTDAVIDRCEAGRDRFAVLNETSDSEVQTIRRQRDTSYGAVYYPRIRVAASHRREGYAMIPPCGHVTGIYARTDNDRGVNKPPANEVVRGIDILSGELEPLSHTINEVDQELLTLQGVNVIRDFRLAGRGIRVWTARTMSSDALWKYVSVRRLFIFIEQSIVRGTQWTVFEPNSDPTWLAMTSSITNFLTTLWRTGALAGATQDEAFFVKCDRTTMTQDDIDSGRLICVVGVAPVKPAEFVILHISRETLKAS